MGTINNIVNLQGISQNVPFNTITFPNSENINPPVKKEARRVVEPSTRNDVSMELLRQWHEKRYAFQMILRDERLRAYVNDEIEQGRIVDIEVK